MQKSTSQGKVGKLARVMYESVGYLRVAFDLPASPPVAIAIHPRLKESWSWRSLVLGTY